MPKSHFPSMFPCHPRFLAFLLCVLLCWHGGVSGTPEAEDFNDEDSNYLADADDGADDYGPDDLINVYKRLYDFGMGKKSGYTYLSQYKRLPVYNFGLGKRAPHQPYSFGLGKRPQQTSKSIYSFGLGKRESYEYPMGKRPKEMYSFGLGKRSVDYYADDADIDEYGAAEGDGDVDKRAKYSFGLGKRGPQPYSFGLGKRAHSKLVYGFGLGKRRPQQYSFGLGKRAEDGEKIYSSAGLGKRPDSHRYAFGLGKRSTSSSEEDNLQRTDDDVKPAGTLGSDKKSLLQPTHQTPAAAAAYNTGLIVNEAD